MQIVREKWSDRESNPISTDASKMRTTGGYWGGQNRYEADSSREPPPARVHGRAASMLPRCVCQIFPLPSFGR